LIKNAAFLLVGLICVVGLNKLDLVANTDDHLVIKTNIEFLPEEAYFPKYDFNRERIVFVFSLDDCPLCLFEAQYWGAAMNEFGDQVFGLAVVPEKTQEIYDFGQEYGLSIKTKSDVWLQLSDFLSEHDIKFSTPMKIFIDKTNHIRVIEYGTKDMNRHPEFIDRALEYIEDF